MSDPEADAGPFELASSALGALPLIDRFLQRIDLPGVLERHLPAGDARTTLPAATAVGGSTARSCTTTRRRSCCTATMATPMAISAAARRP
ncbi:MAG: hypothetical protein LC777_06290 [Actinobacteria bacterium]|nr:hypothetical protein [Actinomycetota bacterium]